VPVRGQYIEVDPPRRLVVSWGIAGSDDFPPGSSQVEFTLTATSNGTALRLVHVGLPDTYEQGHAAGWRHYFARLQVAALGSDPGADMFVPPQRHYTASRSNA
jgi:uncharacterized protein YndB with AHSA1/START domain